MKKKSKILSLLALGILFPALTLTGCVGAESATVTPKHENSHVYQNNDTHHWHKCACGENNCTAKYNQEVHEFVEVNREYSILETKITYACDCGEIKLINQKTDEGLFEIAKKLFSQYTNYERSFTTTISGNDEYIFTTNLQEDGMYLYVDHAKIKAVKDGDAYKVFIQETAIKEQTIMTLDEIKADLDSNTYCGYICDLNDYLLGKINSDYAIEQDGNTYVITYEITGKEIKVQFTESAILRMICEDDGGLVVVNFEDGFDKELFDGFDVSEGFTEV